MKKNAELFEMYQCQQYAFKMAYVGINYQGLTYQGETENTIEEFFFLALEKFMLI